MNSWQQHLRYAAETACLLEVMSPKPGNVSPGKEFAGSAVDDFRRSASAIADEMAMAAGRSLGTTILRSVQATRKVVGHNTNLGIILLISPLAAVPESQELAEGIRPLLAAATTEDAKKVYQAIRLAEPSGLGSAEQQDVNSEPTTTLQECMRQAAGFDLIAAQYVNGFDQVLGTGAEWMRDAQRLPVAQPDQIGWLAVRLLSEYGDSLIGRKCGPEMSACVRRKAAHVLQSGRPGTPASRMALNEFDQFLRADGNRRNPGTTADLIAGILFAGLRDGWFVPDGGWYL